MHWQHNSSCKNRINISQLINQYYNLYPDLTSNSMHGITFGTSGHRGSSKRYSFNEAHLLAISQSIVQTRLKQGITGPCYLGKDTHALSEPAFISVLEVLTANYVNVIIQENNGYTPTPVISHAIIRYNKKNYYNQSKADGIILTSSHNPPEDGGIKYNSIYGGPASPHVTHEIEHNANKFLLNNLYGVRRITLNQALKSGYIHTKNFVKSYVNNLSTIINMQAIKTSGLKLKVHPLGGSSIAYWQEIAQFYQLDLTLVNESIDKTFSFLSPDYDGCIRIDCSSKLAITEILSSYRKDFDLLFLNDPDCDRHGIITSVGLLKSNHYFAVVIDYLFHNRLLWKKHALSIGNTCVSSNTLINQIARTVNCSIIEVPVGFKWFSQRLFNGYLGFASEESSGASFLDFNGTPWSTDKDGIVMCLLSAEIIAITNKCIQKYYNELANNFNISSYNRTQLSINYLQKSLISQTSFDQINIIELADDQIIQVLNIIPSNIKLSMSGLKIITRNGWIACRLSGTELIYKIYCESLLGVSHRLKIEKEIKNIIFKIIHNK